MYDFNCATVIHFVSAPFQESLAAVTSSLSMLPICTLGLA